MAPTPGFGAAIQSSDGKQLTMKEIQTLCEIRPPRRPQDAMAQMLDRTPLALDQTETGRTGTGINPQDPHSTPPW